jgi:hypothetical protein
VAPDEQKIDETVLALLRLTLHEGTRAWKSHDWNSLNRLHEKGFIEDPVNKAKSVVLTQKGFAKSDKLFRALFVEDGLQTNVRGMTDNSDQELAREAKAIVALAFRNGPIEDMHAGTPCPVCSGKPNVSHITDDEMKLIMKNAVAKVYKLLRLKASDPDSYGVELAHGLRYTAGWDEPE